jgi:rhodanese-related sulfurtransferase
MTSLPDNLTPIEAHERLRAGARLFDVRDADEFSETHVAGAVLIPLDELPERIDDFPRDANLILICRSGRRSGLAQDALRKLGIGKVANLTGGIIAWEEAGLPVVRHGE